MMVTKTGKSGIIRSENAVACSGNEWCLEIDTDRSKYTGYILCDPIVNTFRASVLWRYETVRIYLYREDKSYYVIVGKPLRDPISTKGIVKVEFEGYMMQERKPTKKGMAQSKKHQKIRV